MRKLFLLLVAVLACSWSMSALARTITGSVLDAANNDPLIGATIMPVGGGQGTDADFEGNFTLNIPDNVKQITFSYVGYKSKTLPVQSEMHVYLESSVTSLDDVVVIAYGTGTKESLTGSVAVVDSKAIEDRPVTSVTQALEGNAPGVQVNNSTGQPGSSPSIRIRGFNSFTSSAQSPLYVVDGIVYQGDIADINPADIESMSVLKDAASCALYGNRGANGVILINTKRAKGQGKVDVTLQVRQGMYTRGLPEYDTLGANQWMETALQGWARGRQTAGAPGTYDEILASSAAAFINGFVSGTNIYGGDPSTVFDATGKLTRDVLPGYNDLDWWDAISRTGHRQEYNVNATGATEKFDAFASVGYLKENGYMLQTDYERFNGRFVANYNPVSFLKLGADLSASYSESDQGIADPDNLNAVTNPFLTMFYAPIQPYYAHYAADAEDGSYKAGDIMYGSDGQPVWNTDGMNKGSNIAWLMRLDSSTYKNSTINGSLYGTAILPYGFELTVRGSMMRSFLSGKDYFNRIIGSQQGQGGMDLQHQNVGSHTFMQTLNWSREYGLHHIDVMLDHENYQYGYNTYFLRKSGQLIDGNYSMNNFQNLDADNESQAEIRTESYLGRARYNFDQKYFAEFSLRRDGTSRFAKNNRWGTFWSVGASWILTKEKFLHNVDWLNYLKLRLAYGSVGNDAAASAYSYLTLYSPWFTYEGIGTMYPGSIGTSDLTWESTKTLDIALEGSLFNDRFNFTIGYFDKRNADLLYSRTLPFSQGTVGNSGLLPSVMQNIGTMSNRGWELQFGVDIIRNADFRWNFNIDASFIKNKIIKLPDNQDIVGQALFQGKSLYEKFTYDWAGVDQRTGNSLYYMHPDSPEYYKYDENGNQYYDEQLWMTNLANASKSGNLFVDENGNYLTDRATTYAKRALKGSALPTVFGSFSTNFSWKGINLGLLFTYSLGGKTYNGNYASLMSLNTQSSGALHKDILNSWQGTPTANADLEHVGMTYNPANSDLSAIEVSAIPTNGQVDPNGVPVLNTQLDQYNNASSSRFLVSSSYLCMKNINISYDFPKKWVNAMKMQNLNLGFSVDNLFLITKQKGMNPQYSFSGGQGAYYVPSRVFSFQLTVKF